MLAEYGPPSAGLYGVFAEQPGGGSVAGVVISPVALSHERMQAVARDFGAPTTGFVVVEPDAQDSLPVRFFSPRQEMDACGYVTLAAATALRDIGYWAASSTGTLTAAGGRYKLTVSAESIRLDVHVLAHRVVAADDRRAIARALGLALADLPCEVVTTGLRHLVVPVAEAAALSAYTPDRATAEELGSRYGVDTIALISSQTKDHAVRLRDLCAPVGDLEEPASGTTSAAVTDFVHRHLGDTTLVVRQGEDMGRPSVLRTTLRPDRIVELTGTARPVLIGQLG